MAFDEAVELARNMDRNGKNHNAPAGRKSQAVRPLANRLAFEYFYVFIRDDANWWLSPGAPSRWAGTIVLSLAECSW